VESLKGKRAVVTGASKGLGRRIVENLAAEGAKVALFARPSAELNDVAAALGEAVIACPCDIRSPDAVREAMAKAAKAMGGIDILINNAAALRLSLLEDITDDWARDEIETNLMAPIWTVREAAAHLRRARGHIVNVTSEGALQHPPYLGLYSATKAAVEALSFGLKRELAPDVRVTVLRAGRMRGSSLQQDWTAPEAREGYLEKNRLFGMNADNGAFMDFGSIAEALVQILKLPEEISSDLVVLRGRIG
jgi:NAD(P)-dependent dehydrogenase (short-subunit alcohol dehydrogenase family)